LVSESWLSNLSKGWFVGGKGGSRENFEEVFFVCRHLV
jgi:hypothetical protein